MRIALKRVGAVKWLGTGAYLTGMAMTAANSFHPWNLAWGALGGALWTAAGVMTADRPLTLVEAVAVGIYVVGLAAAFTT